jgi:hypothetical protein
MVESKKRFSCRRGNLRVDRGSVLHFDIRIDQLDPYLKQFHDGF